MLRAFYLFLLVCFPVLLWGNGNEYAKTSVLAEGRWVRIQVDETGIYKLTAADLKKMGFSDISKVSVFGYGGWMLDEDFSLNSYIDDLPEVATWKGDGDYLLFYAKGPVRWTYSSTEGFVHTRNPYATAGYYFLSETDNPLRMETVQSLTEEAVLRIDTYDDYMLHEQELVSISGSGRQLFGESFLSKTSQDFTFKIPGIVNEQGYVSFRFVAKPTSKSTSVTLSVDDQEIVTRSISSTTDNYTYAKEPALSTTRLSWNGDKKESTKVNVLYNGLSTDMNVYLDYIRLQMKRTLQSYGTVTFFRNVKTKSSTARYIIQNATSNMVVFDVTDGEKPQLIETSMNGTDLSFAIAPRTDGSLREFALVQLNGTFAVPAFVEEVKNQNLHALDQQDMVIIAPKAFTEQAERLAEAHRTSDLMAVYVADPQSIYNEFSSGMPEATAYRRFMKMFYDRRSSEADAPKYLLLFGDGSYDNRQLTNEWKSVDRSNFLLTFQSENSISAGSSSGTFVTDDYFGFLEDNSGQSITSSVLKIGIGRFPVRTVSQAKNAVDKVAAYMENQETGSWKNTVTFVADDGSSSDNFSTAHIKLANDLAETLTSSNPEMMAKKLFFDAHKKDNSSGFATYPTIKQGIQQQLKDGTLLINYVGHGNNDSWSDEKVLTQSDISQFSYSKLPVWITATCDFTPFDAVQTSAGEAVFLNASSGGIALLTTMRVAYAETNEPINKALINSLFERTDGVYPRLGDAIMNMKNNVASKIAHQKLNFILIGDPALRLNYPTEEIQVTAVNGVTLSATDTVTFKALEKITIKGAILHPDGTKNTDFNGEINPTVFDSQANVTTLSNNGNDRSFTFSDYPNKIYIGNSEVKNGEFEFSFIVPIDISYSNAVGKMSLYAVDKTTDTEAKGAFDQYKVGGTGGSIDDTEGPEIRSLFLNDSTFTDGAQVNSTPLLSVNVWDASGINMTGSSIGHDITLVIDGQSSLTYNLNAYYKTITDAEGEGQIQFLIPELSAGIHTAELKVWDIVNNSTTVTFTFEVVEGLKPKLYELRAAPSPAREQVTFYLYHNRPESTVSISILVYDMMGRIQWKGETKGSSGYSAPLTMQWDLCNSSGSRLRPGIYIYRAAISTDNSKEATDSRKLIILAQ